MCVSCGCSDDAQARVTLLENSETTDTTDNGDGNHHYQ